MTTKVRKVDGGYELFIPEELATGAGLAEGAEVVITAGAGRLVAEANPPQREYCLNTLLSEVTPEILHGKFDWGRPVGRERFLGGRMTSTSYFPERDDLIWVDFDPQSGHEQAGYRPGLVLS